MQPRARATGSERTRSGIPPRGRTRRALRALWRRRGVAASALAVLVFGTVLALRGLGLLEPLELSAYDALLAARPRATRPDPRIVLIEITEDDLQALREDPVSDRQIARALELLVDAGVQAVGLDVLRDLPIPPGTEALDQVLQSYPNLIGVRFYARVDALRGLACPPALVDSERCAFADVAQDRDGVVRRGILYLRPPGGETGVSLPLSVALSGGMSERFEERPDGSHAVRLGETLVPSLDPDAGGYVDADTRGYQILLDYAGAHAAFETFSLGELLAGELGSAVLRGRFAMLGYSAVSKHDFFRVPIPAQQPVGEGMPGVALHAHVLSQLLRLADGTARPLRTLPESVEITWVAVLTLLGGLLGARVRRAALFVLCLLGGIGALAGVAALLFLGGIWLPSVAPGLAFGSSAVLLTAQALSREQAEIAALEQLLGHELATMVRGRPDEFLEGGRPLPSRFDGSYLFADLRGYTAASEQMEAAEVLAWINDFMEEMTRVILDHGGIVDSFAGDGIKADFGVPLAGRSVLSGGDGRDAKAQAARRAVDAALDMALAFSTLIRRWQLEGSRSASGMRVGIYSGPAVAGCVGATDRLKYTVVGDAVNTASRLESFDQLPHDFEREPCRILIGETTRALLPTSYRTRHVGDFHVKGKTEKIQIHALLGRANSAEADEGDA